MPGPPESPGEGPTPEIGDAAVVPSGAALRHGPPPGADPPPASATPVPPVAPPVVAVGGPLPPASTAPASSPTGVPVPRAGQATSLGPAAQAGAAFVMLARQPGEAQSLTLHLQPPDLGRLAINIEQPKDSGARISLTAEQPETLLLLMRDQPAMHKALDSAGIAAEGRTLSFHLAAAQGIAPPVAASAASDNGGSLSNGGNSQGGGAQTGMGDPSGRNQHGSQPRQTATGFTGAADPSAGFNFPAPPSITRSQPRGAVDITA